MGCRKNQKSEKKLWKLQIVKCRLALLCDYKHVINMENFISKSKSGAIAKKNFGGYFLCSIMYRGVPKFTTFPQLCLHTT